MEEQPEIVEACLEKWDFNWLLHRATQRVGGAYAEEIAKFGISLRGQLVLQALANEEVQRTQLKLGAMLGLDKTTLTSELDKLERSGLVLRVPDPNDRRVRTPVITDKGRELQKEAGDALAEVERAFHSRFSPEEMAIIRKALQDLSRGEGPMHGSCI
ncbi:MarR family winged helix-turn-helix transcriptional regulator [Lentzea flaviverrucosa]|uniref:DNA-binding transcriptional regulator, MarR family n=1 Tax=Lentzea flaviverrucosa TaxID=200379 RepID=A0A1H9XQZ1_9PSEU|nr:MarR family transcriptional regulator [Lentzea flaviverrucosa]RDI19851.1 DNA-binding MarR family transcriptional regulator [Lentzea flaviverrucosa]SES48551.1 DNA-binding transcriptional regulator, MarR family [Lentzea flaviverrucosa]